MADEAGQQAEVYAVEALHYVQAGVLGHDYEMGEDPVTGTGGQAERFTRIINKKLHFSLRPFNSTMSQTSC